MLTKTQAIVLRMTKYGDQKMIVDLYTEVYGRIACAVRMPTTKKGKMRRQLFQPLTLLNIEVDFRQQKPFQQLRDIQLAMPWSTIGVDPIKMTLAMFLSEVMWAVTRQEHGDSALYRFFVGSIEWLDVIDGRVGNFHLAFLVALSRHLGIQPTGDDYEPTTVFDMRGATFTFGIPGHNDVLQAADAAFLPLLLRMNYRTMSRYRFSRSERQRCLNLILYYYRLHLSSMPELKSLPVLSAMFE